MKILAWNVQGAKKGQIREEIRYLKQAQQPDLLFLIETLTSEETTKQLLPQLGFDQFDYTLPVNHSGGIWVLWNTKNIMANVLLKEDRAIHMLVFDIVIQKFSIISGIYAPAQSGHKDVFWNHLRDLHGIVDMPWCLIGDFNELECHDDKTGGPPAGPSRLTRLPSFLNYCQARSLPVLGRRFTWKKRIHGHLIYEKLDRAIGRQDWCCQYPDCCVINGPFTCSDHCYVMLDTNPAQFAPRKSLFRYQPHWSHYHEAQSIVRKKWLGQGTGAPMFRFTRKLRRIKRELKIWSRSKFSAFRTQIEKNTSKLQFVESRIITNPQSPRLNDWHFRLLKQREKILLFNKRYWGNLARKKWLVDGDRNSRYFHQAAKIKKRNCSIIRIKDASGIWLDDIHVIRQQFLHDFTQRFTSARESLTRLNCTLTTPVVTTEENDALIQPITDAEIYDAVFQMDPHKAPGSDGFGASFYQDHWVVIKELLCVAIKDFFRSGKLLKEVNHTLITLIPKVANPESTAHFRPISLCNTVYKIVAKILVNRMKPILQRIIHPTQSAFIPHRTIHDNILIAHEIVNKFKIMKGKKGFVALKLDMEKAYDRLEWDFLLSCLKQLGFHDTWIQWIKECISTVSYSFIINNEPHGFFKPSRGLRQGDPLSPYLFTICMDVLAKRLHALSLNPKSGIGIKIAQDAERIPCLLFADDSLLFCKATPRACQQLKEVLDTFCTQSGQLVNFHKSSILFSNNTRNLDKQVVGGIFNIPHSSSLGHYLGCSLFQGRPPADLFRTLTSKAVAKLDDWKAKSFSKAGRIILIQSNLESLPIHTMQCYKLPSRITDQLDRIHREFFWKKNTSEKGLPLVAWDKICRPKILGGLGLRKSAAVNIAFLAKLAWKILTQPENLWVQQMRAKYGAPERFFEARSKPTDSWVWKCLLRLRPFIKQGIRWKVGNGRSINFWTDNWCAEDNLLSLLDRDPSSIPDLDMKVSAFISPDKQWDSSHLSLYLPSDFIQTIQSIPLPITDVADSFCWGYFGSGAFSTKSATWKAHDNIPRDQPKWKYQWIWKLDVAPKIRIFLWQLCHNSLPSRGTLMRRGLQLDPLCSACDTDIEDTDHIFLHCPMVRQVWDLAVAHQWLPSLPFPHSDSPLREQLHLLVQNQYPRVDRVVLLLWSIWKSRNALIFRTESIPPMGTLLRAKRSWAEWMLRASSSGPNSSISYSSPHPHHLPKDPHLIGWTLPRGGFIKINFDGSKSLAGAAAGFVLRSWQGGFIKAGSRFLENASILVAEATAMRDGISTALQAGFRRLEVEGDNQIVIKAVQKQIQVPWQIAPILQDIWNMIGCCETVLFRHIYREGNMAADWVAKYGCSIRGHSLTCFSSPPSRQFLFVLVDDNLGRTLARRAT